MASVCSKCGLPKTLCVCSQLQKESAKIKIMLDRRRYGKAVTIVSGIEKPNAKEVMKKLKSKLACGGTYKDGNIELQGRHKKRVKSLLLTMGFTDDQVEVR